MAHRFALVAGLALAGVNATRDLFTFVTAHQTAPVVAFNDWAAQAIPPDATVAGDLMHIPLYRRGGFYSPPRPLSPPGHSAGGRARGKKPPPPLLRPKTPPGPD